MRRYSKRYSEYTGVSVFAFLLCFVLWTNLWPSGSGRTLAWNEIRYRSKATTFPELRGVCPGLASSQDPALVVSRMSSDGDSRWLTKLASRYHLCIYTVDAPYDQNSVYSQVPANRAHEAMPYLTFIIENYENMPEAGAVFIHGSRFAWHNDAVDYDNAGLLADLNITAALKPSGYHNLRCDWSASTCSAKESQPQGSLETVWTARLQPWNARAVSDAALPGALQTLFGGSSKSDALNTMIRRSDAVRSQCCAQFVVSRSNIWRHSKAEYIHLRQWLLDSGPNAAPRDDKVAGRVMSYLWHILFTPSSNFVDLDELNAQACPSAEVCYCRLYGRCDLPTCTSAGRCRGQYTIPKGYRLPEDWERTHVGLI